MSHLGGGASSTEADSAGIALISARSAGARIAGGAERVDEVRFTPVVALPLLDSMFLDCSLDSLLKFAGLEEGRSIGNSSNRLVRLKDHAGEAHVELLACFQIEAQSAEHECDETAGASTDDEVEVIAWLGNFVSPGSATLHFDKGSVHQLLDDDEDRVTADASSICAG